jgi:hypothetical protein
MLNLHNKFVGFTVTGTCSRGGWRLADAADASGGRQGPEAGGGVWTLTLDS